MLYDARMIPKTPILRVAVPSPLYQCFDYWPPVDSKITTWVPGLRIKVPFGRREVVGILLEVLETSEIDPKKLKPALEVLDEEPLLDSVWLKLTHWASQYYQYPIGEVMLGVLPKALRQGKPFKGDVRKLSTCSSSKLTTYVRPLSLNPDQQKCMEQIAASSGFQCFVLEGVTGSGKTEVYLQAIDRLLKQGKQALVLVPEIALTPQTLARFQARFPEFSVLAYHSGLTDKTRADVWRQVQEGVTQVVVGTRSAVFLPWKNPGIIILDEEHDASFKQQTGFRYSARDLAVFRAQLENIPVLLGSATPSLESLYNLKRERYQHLQLPERAGESQKPQIHLLNLCQQPLKGGLSPKLLESMGRHLAAGGQVMLFLNRRGYAPVLMCHDCAWMATCDRCDAKFNLHQNPPRLRCHHCESVKPVPQKCGACGSPEIFAVGQGTEQLEETVQEHFPQYKTLRIDRDSTRVKGSLESMLQSVQDEEAKILIGTQLLAKGHHFPALSMVAIVDADGGLFSSDFRALERMGQLIVQVSGRAGRAEILGEVYIQTHHPDNPFLQLLLNQGYPDFAKALLEERIAAGLPPHTHMAVIRAESTHKEKPRVFLEKLRSQIHSKHLRILGPIPAPMERKAGRVRAQLILEASNRSQLQAELQRVVQRLVQDKTSREVRWSIDVDPVEAF